MQEVTTNNVYNSPQDFLNAIYNMLSDRADFSTARQLAFQAVERYPDDSEILNYAYLLAPPMIIKGSSNLEERNLAENWLKFNHFKYRNLWVALQKGKLISQASSYQELINSVRDSEKSVMVAIG